MPKPRNAQISLDVTPYYHCISRCVRRAYLCGFDKVSGQSFEHRRDWIEQRLLYLGQVFAIDIAAYAVMNNHIHLVLRINYTASQQWSTLETITRWHKLFKGNSLSKRALAGESLNLAEQALLNIGVALWRARLTTISWFMRCLNEPIARQANAEDNVTGRFWEGRFKSQALLDEQALAACMAYVDLNPVKAGIAEAPETSEYTSIQRRINVLQTFIQDQIPPQPSDLLKFIGNPREAMPDGLPFPLVDYLELVDWTSQILRNGFNHSEKNAAPPLLERLQLSKEGWFTLTQRIPTKPNYIGGLKASLRRIKATIKNKRAASQKPIFTN